jgi:N-methylhydantoinase B
VEIREAGPDAPVAVSVQTDGGHGELTAAVARAAVRAAARQILAAEVPGGAVLGGASEALAIATPWDAVPSAVTTGAGRFAEAQLLQDAVLTAFADALPHLTHAADGAPVLLDLRGEWGDGSRFRLRLGLGAGAGASVFGDGLSHGASAFFPLRLDAVEAVERAAPIRISRFQLQPDSGGPGQYHGGLGALLELELLEGRVVVDILLPGRAMGLRGGMRGGHGRLTRISEEDGTREDLGPAQVSLRLKPGDRLILESPGGGGWGVPYQRSIMRLEEDLTRGLVSPIQSRNRYGLILKPDTLEKDDHLTYRVRHYLLTTLTAEDLIAGEQLLDD